MNISVIVVGNKIDRKVCAAMSAFSIVNEASIAVTNANVTSILGKITDFFSMFFVAVASSARILLIAMRISVVVTAVDLSAFDSAVCAIAAIGKSVIKTIVVKVDAIFCMFLSYWF